MALRNLRIGEDPILRKTSKEVKIIDEKIITILDDMHETLLKEDGVGLACVQVGILKRIFIAQFHDDVITECINPEILESSGEQIGQEGCLSVPGETGFCNRPDYVKLKYMDRNGETHIEELYDFSATVCMHEYDHLDGILYIDKLVEMPEGYDEYEEDDDDFLEE